MLAGVTMNVLAAFVLFAVTYAAGWETLPAVVGDLEPGGPAWEHGVRKGDEFFTIDGNRIIAFSDIGQEAVTADELEVVLRRDGTLLPPMRLPTRDLGAGLRQIGVRPSVRTDGTLFVEAEGRAARAGFATGDRVVAVDGNPVASWDEAEKACKAARRETVWTLERDGVRRDVTLPWATLDQAMIGVQLTPPSDHIVVQRGGPAAKAGLATGDRVVKVGGVEVTPFVNVKKLIDDASVTGALEIQRGDRTIPVALPTGADRKAFAESVAMLAASSGKVHAWLLEGESAARAAGLPDGCELVEADGTPVKERQDFQDAVKTAFKEHRAISVKWRDAAATETTTAITPEPLADLGDMGPMPEMTVFREANPFAAAALAADRTVRWIDRIIGTLGSLFSGGLGADKLSGPLGISTQTYSSAKSSWQDFLLFLGMISMNLAVLNVLPVPLLDGGQLAVHTIERIRRKPIPEKVLEGVMWAGLVLLLGLVVYVTRNDIVHMMRN
jgi:regulator of sigma E protease